LQNNLIKNIKDIQTINYNLKNVIIQHRNKKDLEDAQEASYVQGTKKGKQRVGRTNSFIGICGKLPGIQKRKARKETE
jgi:hypothetical protein